MVDPPKISPAPMSAASAWLKGGLSAAKERSAWVAVVLLVSGSAYKALSWLRAYQSPVESLRAERWKYAAQVVGQLNLVTDENGKVGLWDALASKQRVSLELNPIVAVPVRVGCKVVAFEGNSFNAYEVVVTHYETIPSPEKAQIPGEAIPPEARADNIPCGFDTDPPQLRYDNAFVLGGGILGIVLVLIYTATLREAPSVGVGEDKLAEDILRTALARADESARDMLRRSQFLMRGGLLMAFVGLVVFSLAGQWDPGLLPTSLPPSGWASNVFVLSRAARPTLILISIEAIAAFLLSQHRAALEDYKTFYRVVLKRTNYLASLRLIEQAPKSTPPENYATLSAALLAEDLNATLCERPSGTASF